MILNRDNTFVRKKLAVTLFAVLVLCASNLHAVFAAENSIDLSKKARYSLGLCETVTQMDCLEPEIIVTHKDGSQSIARHVSSLFDGPFLDIFVKPTFRAHRFKVPFGSTDGPVREFEVEINLATPSMATTRGLSVGIFGRSQLINSSECDSPFTKLCRQFTVDPDDSFTLHVRTQILYPDETNSSARNADISRETYLNGERWTLKGEQASYGEGALLGWGIPILGPNENSRFRSANCSKFGVLFRSSNAIGQTQPSWNYLTNSLNFGLQGFHTDINGDLTRGFFKARIPKPWLDCAYPGNNLSKANQVIVSITYDNGDIQAATTNTRVTSEIIYVEVPMMHFSSPTVQISNAMPETATPKASSKPTPKVKYCIKGKAKKKLSGSKCPAGWKLA